VRIPAAFSRLASDPSEKKLRVYVCELNIKFMERAQHEAIKQDKHHR
jgi:hypothetical protein